MHSHIFSFVECGGHNILWDSSELNYTIQIQLLLLVKITKYCTKYKIQMFQKNYNHDVVILVALI